MAVLGLPAILRAAMRWVDVDVAVTRWSARIAWGLCAICVVLTVVGVALYVVDRSVAPPATFGSRDAAVVSMAVFIAFPVFGGLIATHRPGNRLWWLFSAVGLSAAGWVFADGYAVHAVFVAPGSLPGGEAVAWLGNLVWVPGWGLAVILYLLFPTGAPPSPRWRPLVWAAGLGTAALVLAFAVAPGPLRDYPYVSNPIGLEQLPLTSQHVGIATFVIIGVLGVAAVGSLFVRLRVARGVERQQLKWVLYAGAIAIAGIAVFALLAPFGVRSALGEQLTTATRAAIPLAAGIAILRYRLYDIDVVINKTLVFGGLAAFITAVYAIVVVGMGTLVGRGDEPNFAVSVAATAVVAVAFQPVRERLQTAANRLVYGVRATPYEVLSRFSARMGETMEPDEVLHRMVRLLAEGTGAASARLWLRIGTRLRLAAVWRQEAPGPDVEAEPEDLEFPDGQLPAFTGADRVATVSHQGELLGALTVTKPRGEHVTPTDDKLLADLAAQGGLVVRNVRLTAELMERLEELRASRQRLVAAQDDARRQLERNLHDGAQQQLVALKIKLGLARTLAEREEVGKVATLLGQLALEADDAIETLRDLARGIYPPLLASEGLVVALSSQAHKAPLPVTVEAGDIGRFTQDLEAAVYFCCLEALQNIAKYAGASCATITLEREEAALAFTVSDDGCGFDADAGRGSGLVNMLDRVDALGGTLQITSAPGAGCTVAGRLPVEPTDGATPPTSTDVPRTEPSVAPALG